MYGGMARLVVRTKAENVSSGSGSGASLRAGDPALSLEAVTLPAAVLDEGGLALCGVAGGQRRAAAEDQAGGKRRQRHVHVCITHRLFSP